MPQRSPLRRACSARYSAVSRPVNPVAPNSTRSSGFMEDAEAGADRGSDTLQGLAEQGAASHYTCVSRGRYSARAVAFTETLAEPLAGT